MAGIDRDTVSQLRSLLRPLAMRIANTVSRAVVKLANDSTRLQLLQLGVLSGETVDNAEHVQAYGFSSVPLGGAEAVVVFPGGDRSHPLVIAVPDRRYRPTAGEGGQVTMYHYKGAKVTMLENGNVEIMPGPGGQVLVGGSPVQLPLKSDIDALITTFNAHVHTSASPGNPTSAPATPAVSATGTSVLKAQ